MYSTRTLLRLLPLASLLSVLPACSREAAPAPAPAPVSTTANAGSPATAGASAAVPATKTPVEVVTLPDVFIADGLPTTLHVTWKIPAGTGINDEAPFHVRWTTSVGLSEVPPEAKSKGSDVHSGFDITVAPLPGEPAAQLAGLVNVVVCDVETHKVCLPVQRRIEVTFSVQKGGKQKVFAEVPLPAARPQG